MEYSLVKSYSRLTVNLKDFEIMSKDAKKVNRSFDEYRDATSSTRRSAMRVSSIN